MADYCIHSGKGWGHARTRSCAPARMPYSMVGGPLDPGGVRASTQVQDARGSRGGVGPTAAGAPAIVHVMPLMRLSAQ